MAARLGVLTALLFLSGCATGSNCAGWSQINPSRSDQLTALTAAQILEHNRQGEKQGCWSPRGK